MRAARPCLIPSKDKNEAYVFALSLPPDSTEHGAITVIYHSNHLHCTTLVDVTTSGQRP